MYQELLELKLLILIDNFLECFDELKTNIIAHIGHSINII